MKITLAAIFSVLGHNDHTYRNKDHNKSNKDNKDMDYSHSIHICNKDKESLDSDKDTLDYSPLSCTKYSRNGLIRYANDVCCAIVDFLSTLR